MSDEIAHEAVVSSLMDLQARLRGDDGDDHAATHAAVDTAAPQDLVQLPETTPVFVNLPEGPLPARPVEVLSVVEDDLMVAIPADEDQQLQVLSDGEEGYFAPVTPLHPASTPSTDSRLAALTDRLTRLESELDGVIGQIEKVDPARLDRLEAVHDELGTQHEGLKATIDTHFTDLQRSIDERLRGTEG